MGKDNGILFLHKAVFVSGAIFHIYNCCCCEAILASTLQMLLYRKIMKLWPVLYSLFWRLNVLAVDAFVHHIILIIILIYLELYLMISELSPLYHCTGSEKCHFLSLIFIVVVPLCRIITDSWHNIMSSPRNTVVGFSQIQFVMAYFKNLENLENLRKFVHRCAIKNVIILPMTFVWQWSL